MKTTREKYESSVKIEVRERKHTKDELVSQVAGK